MPIQFVRAFVSTSDLNFDLPGGRQVLKDFVMSYDVNTSPNRHISKSPNQFAPRFVPHEPKLYFHLQTRADNGFEL